MADLTDILVETEDELRALQPLGEESRRMASADIKATLRDLIMKAELKPGTVLSQVDVARRLGVSRTPVREALRMLGQEGLVTGEANMRCKVVGFDAAEIDTVYARRILIEPLAAAITVRTAGDADVTALEEALAGTMTDEAHADFDLWQKSHHLFHARLIASAPAPLQASVNEKNAQTQRYRALLRSRYPAGWWRRGEVEHGEIAAAFRDRKVNGVIQALGRHIARSGLEVLADVAPQHEPVAIRMAVMMLPS